MMASPARSRSQLAATAACTALLGLGSVLFTATQSACFGQCLAAPVCADDEIEVEECSDGDADCYENTVCGTTIYCTQAAACAAAPSCDPGDDETNVCPDGESCYDVTVCSQTITCIDSDPSTECPDLEPTVGEPCDPTIEPVGGDCYYEPCGFYGCDPATSTWVPTGGCG